MERSSSKSVLSVDGSGVADVVVSLTGVIGLVRVLLALVEAITGVLAVLRGALEPFSI